MLTSVAIEGNAAVWTHSLLDMRESIWERELVNPQQEEKRKSVADHVKHPSLSTIKYKATWNSMSVILKFTEVLNDEFLLVKRRKL